MTSEHTRPGVVVVGGGISGLAAAWELTRAAPDLAITVLEGSDTPGGKLRTEDLLDHPVDAGADAFLVRTPDALDLCHELGLDDELVHPAARSALLWCDGALHRLPEGLVLGVPTDLDALAASGILSPEGLARVAQDLELPPEPLDTDTTVGALVRARLGDEAFDKLVGPLLSGVNAGDADELSVQAGAPQLAAAAAAGSLIRGAREQRAASIAAGGADAPVFASLRGGTGRLIDVLLERLRERGVTIVTGREGRVQSIDAATDGWAVTTDAGLEWPARGVVVAVPAYRAATILPPACGLHRDLDELEYSSVAVLGAAYRRSDIAHPLDASGVLVPATEGLLMTACSFGSSKWPHWSDDDVVVLRASAGRHHDRRIATLDDPAFVTPMEAELAMVLGVSGTPLARRVTRWERALPQYRPGHLARVARWDATLDGCAPGVVLAGALTRGLGIPACIRSGRDAAGRVLSRT